ncbi:MAG: TIGR00730 family Rossman fold protein [Tepidisphaeraceae bacterium]
MRRCARANRGRVVGITPKYFVDQGCADHACDELVVVETMRERKHLLDTRGDAFVALPGGLGTLEELIEIWVARQLNMHAKPILLLNVDGFWNPLIELFQQGIEQKFYRKGTLDSVTLVSTVDECVEALARHRK